MGRPNEHERRLVRRLSAGDESAFEEFFEDYFPRLYRFALVRLRGDVETAKEVTQVTLCKVVEKLDSYLSKAPLFTWMCAICRNEIVDVLRRRRRSPEVELLEEEPRVRRALEALVADSDAANPERAALAREARHLVHAVLDHLPRRYGAALEMRYLEGSGVVEIADRLGLSYKAAESTLSRARAAFQRAFLELDPGKAR